MSQRCIGLGLAWLVTVSGLAGASTPPPATRPYPVISETSDPGPATPRPADSRRSPAHALAGGSAADDRVASAAGTAMPAPRSDVVLPRLGDRGRVIPLPEEVVRAAGIAFGAGGDLRFILPAREAARLPGSFADPMRYLQNLPGVTNDSDFDGLLFVRGGEGDQNRILVDQVSVSDAYHFAGVVSVLNADVIDRLDFMPGGYTAEYGDALASVLSVRRRIGNPVAVRSAASLSLTTANASLEGPLGGGARGSWLVAARRSYLDQILQGRTAGHPVLPSYYDVDGRLYRKIGDHDLRLGFLASGDRLAARLSDTFTFAPTESSGISWDRGLALGTLNWEHPAGRGKLTQTVAYGGRRQEVELLGGLPQYATSDSRTFDWRGDAKLPAAGLLWSAGGQVTHTHFEYHIHLDRLSLEDPDRRSNPRSPLDTVLTRTDFEGRDVYAAAYAQTQAQAADSALTVIAGVRLEHTSRTGQSEPTPRLRLSWRTPAWGLTLSGAAGSYRQFPGERLEADPQVGNPNLKAERARHLLLGLAKVLPGGGRVSLEGYDKRLDALIAYDPNAANGAPRFLNTGHGVARGVELLVHVPRERWSGWLSYTLGRVVYRDLPGGPEYAPAQDLRHSISVVGRVRPARGWTLGMKWRAHSGRPYTPVIGRENVSEFVEGLDWIPVLGARNSARFPWYHRLDVRAERDFRFAGASASASLEIINLYGRKNLYDYRYVDGFSRARVVEMLPFLPTFGLTVAF